MSRYITAEDIVNRAAIEVGLNPASDVFASTDPNFVQLRNLLTSCGLNLVEAFEWEQLRREHSITTTAEAEYALPTDFDRMIDQTHWNRTDRVPVAGPLSPQQWQYLKGMELASATIYATFRVMQNELALLPDPPPLGVNITFEYISRNWVLAADGTTYKDEPEANSDTILFKPEMIVQYLRFKFLSAKGFATKDAADAFAKAYENATGGNKGAPVLNAGRRRGGIHLLDIYNIPDTGYGG